jgi:hypothetical protein
VSKIGIYYAYWTHDWDADFHPFVDKVADLGFDVLEVNALPCRIALDCPSNTISRRRIRLSGRTASPSFSR